MKLLPFDYAVRNLGRSTPRLVLSVFGSALVVLLVLAAAAFVRGMGTSLAVSGATENVILLGAGSEDAIERSEIQAVTTGLVAATVDGIRTRAGVAFASPQVHVMLPVQTEGEAKAAAERGDEGGQAARTQLLVRGITPAALLVHDRVRLVEGRMPEPGADEVMLGAMVGAAMGVPEGELAVGKNLMLDGRPWRIVGRFAAPATVMEGEAWTSLPAIMTATKRTTISCVVLTLDPERAEFADIALFTKTRPDLELAAISEREYYARLGAFFDPIKFVAWVTAGLIGLGGLLGGLNTMFAAFASRVRELGTLQSLGFRRVAIAISLIQETMLASTAGSLLACAAAIALLDGLAVRFSMGAFGLIVDSSVVIAGLVAGAVLGLFGSIPPAVRCLRLPIPTALKSF